MQNSFRIRYGIHISALGCESVCLRVGFEMMPTAQLMGPPIVASCAHFLEYALKLQSLIIAMQTVEGTEECAAMTESGNEMRKPHRTWFYQSFTHLFIQSFHFNFSVQFNVRQIYAVMTSSFVSTEEIKIDLVEVEMTPI